MRLDVRCGGSGFRIERGLAMFLYHSIADMEKLVQCIGIWFLDS